MVHEAVRLVAVAFQFLTRIPVPAVELREDDLRRASMFFPLVGVAIAAVGGVARWLLEGPLGVTTATVLAVAAMVAVTGAFHEDALADAVDGLWGGWDPARRLAIMRDSSIGAYGTVALILTMLVRVTLLTSVDTAGFARTVVVGHVLGRASTLLLVRLLPPARTDGHGARLADPLGPGGIAVAAVTVTAAVGVSASVWAWVPVLVGVAVTLGVRRLARLRLGGLTGDILGACNQVVHIAAMATIVALIRGGQL